MTMDTTITPGATNDPSLATDGSGGNGGMSAPQRHVIIGVVVGLVGFFVVAGILGLVWRIWGRRGRTDNELEGKHSMTEQSSSRSKHSRTATPPEFGLYRKHSAPMDASANF